MRLAIIGLLLIKAAWTEPRVQIPVTFWDPRRACWQTFDQLEFIRQDIACSRHPPGREPEIGLVGRIVEDGFEIHFTRPLCTIQFLIGENNWLCLDGVYLGTVTFVRTPDFHFSFKTDAETSRRLMEALAK